MGIKKLPPGYLESVKRAHSFPCLHKNTISIYFLSAPVNTYGPIVTSLKEETGEWNY